MPDMPTLDIVGISQLFGIVLASLAIFWGINKAIILSKNS